MNLFAKNIINEGSKRYFDLGTTLCPYFEIGDAIGTDIWLEGQLVGPEEEYLFNGRLFVPGIIGSGTIIDNFPKSPAPSGWYIRKHVDEEGYDLINQADEQVLFGYRTVGNTCLVTTNLYTRSGSLIVRVTTLGLEVRGVQLRLGRHGIQMAA